jgi:sulfonate transport system substrate-binding protein
MQDEQFSMNARDRIRMAARRFEYVSKASRATLGSRIAGGPDVRKGLPMWRRVIVIAVGVTIPLALAAGCGSTAGAPAADHIRIGYPVTTLINGQVGQILIRTDVLKRNGLVGEVVPFTSGPPANEAMAAGSIDVQLTSEGPAVQAALQGVKTTIVATLGTTRDAIVARPGRGIKTVADLRGKTIGVPFGTTPYLHMLQALRRAGLDPDRDVKLVNIPANELAGAFTGGNVDAVAYNEPLPTQLEASGGITISTATLVFVVVARTQYLTQNRAAVVAFIASVAQALGYLVANKDVANRWFASVSRADPQVINEASMRSAFYAAATPPTGLDLGLHGSLVQRLQADVDFFAELAKKPTISIASHVDQGVWPAAQKRLAKAGDQLPAIKGQ